MEIKAYSVKGTLKIRMLVNNDLYCPELIILVNWN